MTKTNWRNIGVVLALAGAVLGGCGSNNTTADAGGDLGTPVTGDTGTPDVGPVGTDSGPPDTGPVGTDSGPADGGPDAGPLPDLGPAPDAGMVACGTGLPLDVSGEINADTRWGCERPVRLTGGIVWVRNNATLTIDPGTIVRGQVRDSSIENGTCNIVCTSDPACVTAFGAGSTCAPGTGVRVCTGGATPPAACTSNAMCTTSGQFCAGTPREQGTALIVTAGSRLIANGTATRPIVFTSDRFGATPGPVPGDWGGVVLLGNAPINLVGGTPPATVQGSIEGIPDTDNRGKYGGTAATGSCGELRYVRIEYAGFRYGVDNELNSLTVAGCGSGTVLEHIQTHLGLDDGIEMFGGLANLKWAVITGTGDDSFDWDQGYSGNVQFVIAHQRRVAGEDRCIEADGNRAGRDNTPLSNPTVYNFSCFGPVNPADATRFVGQQDGVILREGTAGTVRNSVFLNLPDTGVSIQHNETVTRINLTPATLVLGNSIIANAGTFAGTFSNRAIRVVPATAGAPTAAEMAADVVVRTGSMNRIYTDADIAMAGFGMGAFDAANPNFVPAAGGQPSMTAAATPTTPAGFWTAANYIGAVEPGATGAAVWYAGWTRFTP